MNDHHQTETIEAPAYLDDPKVLAYLSKTDADLDRLALEDGLLWAYSKTNPDQLCRQSLIDMVALAFPGYAETPKPSPVLAPAVVQQDQPWKIKGGIKPGRPFAAPTTGKALPSLRMPGGRTVVATKLIQETATAVKVPVSDSGRKLLGYARVTRADYDALRASRMYPDTLMWNLDDGGNVVCRVKRNPSDPYGQRVNDLMGELGLRGFATFEPLRARAAR